MTTAPQDPVRSKPDSTTHPRRARSVRVLKEIGLVILAFLALQWWLDSGLTDAVEAPRFRLPSLAGEVRQVPAPEQLTLVYFFAPWCEVCSASMDNLVWLRNHYSEQELAIQLVALDWSSAEVLRRYARTHELNVPILLGTDSVAAGYSIRGFPTWYLIDGTGQIKRGDLGYSSRLGLWYRTWLTRREGQASTTDENITAGRPWPAASVPLP